MGDMGHEPPSFYGELTGMQPPHTKSKPPPMVIEHEVTLQELYNSATKKITYVRKKLRPDGQVANYRPLHLMSLDRFQAALLKHLLLG